MAVGRLEESYIPVKVGYKTLFRVKLKNVVIVYDGFLGELSPKTVNSIIVALKEALKQGEAEMVRVELINIDSEFTRNIRVQISPLFREHFVEPRIHWKMSIPHDINTIYSHLSRNHRNQLKRIAKKFENEFSNSAIRIQCFQSIEELETLFIDVEKIAKKTYQRGLGVGFVDNEENRTRLILEAEKGWLRMNVLYVNELPCAFWWGTKYHNTFYSCALGFDPDFQQYSPGTYLLTKVLESLCHQEIKELDFGPGDARYKQQFGQNSYQEASINIFAPTLKGICLNFALSTNNGINLIAKYILSRFQVTEILKKHWRRRLRPT